ncbi:MAG: hypothetical protein IH968_16225 [Gemmatimonadetes bacterium]|nr:hypothetical protein [Gemmatimonadota bacterium]
MGRFDRDLSKDIREEIEHQQSKSKKFLIAAIALAMRLYELDHGRRPRQLSELVPDYLPAVPLDPMASDGRVIVYLLEPEPPILYSVGENGVDDGGTFEFDSIGRIDLSKADLPFFLDGVALWLQILPSGADENADNVRRHCGSGTVSVSFSHPVRYFMYDGRDVSPRDFIMIFWIKVDESI